jgi:hypothetical protein
MYSPRIYTYKITFEEVPYYYYGVHKEKIFNEEYWGSPVTNKWCWELYTPKKQILEFFEFSDKGYEKSKKVENRLIKPVLNDIWCLNECCGGIYSLEISRRSGIKAKDLNLGIFSLSKDEMSTNGRKGGTKTKKLKKGIFSRSKEQHSIDSKKGISKLTKDSRSLGGKKMAKKNKENLTGIYSMSSEEKSKAGKKGATSINSQKWKCLETGFITNPGNLTQYQRARGIDTSKRIRVDPLTTP